VKTVWYNNKWFIILLHIAAWVLLFSLPALLTSSHNSEQPKEAKESDLLNTILVWTMNGTWVAFFYLNALVLIPKFVYRNKYGVYIAILALILLELLTQSAFLFGFMTNWEHFVLGRHVLFNFFIYLFMLSCSTAYQVVKDKIAADRINAEKINENLKTELSLLRSQASPHFMFNVLNNMVALARKKSDLLEPSLIKLSSLMRYMLYDADEEKVSLDNEIEYLQSYIDLQQQRFGSKVKLNVVFHPADKTYQLEPMLLIPFVENAFKHGTGMIEDAEIDIHLRAENNVLHFTVQNKYNPSSKEEKDATSGIGLTNVKRRLNLLYGNQQSLVITEKDNRFMISLQIHLS
jgi:two-component system LytT family sensor kinase